MTLFPVPLEREILVQETLISQIKLGEQMLLIIIIGSKDFFSIASSPVVKTVSKLLVL